MFKDKNSWALVLGGSSGFGLASAKKMADIGMNIFVVHRDRRGAMSRIEAEFEQIKSKGVQFQSYNVDALSADGRTQTLTDIADKIGEGKIHLLLHSIALGNLKLLTPQKPSEKNSVATLAASLKIDPTDLQSTVDELFMQGADELVELATPAAYDNDLIAGEEDFAQTVYNMGTSLVSWVQEIHKRNMFSSSARVLGLTSEGNEVAWKSYGAVAAAKTALESVARSIAVEYAPYGIRCNILQPGVTDTPALKLIPGNLQMKAHARRRNPYGRLTTPEDVGGVVALLCQKEADWINGTIIRVDGGEHISG